MLCSDIHDRAKKLFPEMLRKTLGNVTLACKELGVSREWFYRHLRNDSDFKAAFDEVNENVVDFVESKLLQQIKENNTTATIFFLKTRAKHRGYIERVEYTPKPIADDAIDVTTSKEQRDALIKLVK
jgi:hypothetical protein